jgi:predicted porin
MANLTGANNIVGDDGAAALYGVWSYPSRTSNMVRYYSPSINGFVVDASMTTNERKAGTAETSFEGHSLAVNYAAGPLKVALARTDYKTKGNTLTGTADILTYVGQDPKSTISQVSGTYDLGFMQVGAVYFDRDLKDSAGSFNAGTNILGLAGVDGGGSADIKVVSGGNREGNGYRLSARIPVSGALSLVAAFADTDEDVSRSVRDSAGTPVAQGNIIASIGTQSHQLGALYALSKRTTLYALYGASKGKYSVTGLNSSQASTSKDNVSSNAVTSLKSDQFALGIRHDF